MICTIHLFGDQFQDGLKQTMLGSANRKLSRMYRDRYSASPRIEIVADQRALPPLV
jgi:hypothetical protein